MKNASSVDRVVDGKHRITRTFEQNPRVKTKTGTRAFSLLTCLYIVFDVNMSIYTYGFAAQLTVSQLRQLVLEKIYQPGS